MGHDAITADQQFRTISRAASLADASDMMVVQGD